MYGSIALKLGVGFFALVVVTRLLGKKEMSQLTPYDFVFAILLGGIIEESIYDEKVNLLHILFGIALWGGISYTVEKLGQKYEKIRTPLTGTASILVREGKIDLQEMKKNQLEMEQLRALLRTQGVFSLKDVRYVFMETGGQLSVLKKASADPVTPEMLNLEAEEVDPSLLLVDEGEINDDELNAAGKDEKWLKEELKKEGITNIEEVYYAEWSPQEGFYIKMYKD
ncbi:DUF421 domain-containing protein [Neobacillus piezotolerans]|uniref:DUF421 domain-containing protein n=1 Tax=Neobacillus piezotolerans TaxID=2259171 RepID=A0A3D8GQ26_9BACI|nr:DUF421 domain-containing protein [Neobacillus piezotolerans]RDU36600.1 DUF421 domain-containing protein [Neobacillus piezotolerans]